MLFGCCPFFRQQDLHVPKRNRLIEPWLYVRRLYAGTKSARSGVHLLKFTVRQTGGMQAALLVQSVPLATSMLVDLKEQAQ